MVDSTSVLLVFVTLLTGVFVWSRRTYVYWQRRRVKFVQPVHLLGNLKEVLWQQTSFPLLLRDYYFDPLFKHEPVVGIYLFHQPALLIRDLNLVRLILVEDFVSFSMRFSKCDKRVDKLAANSLFFVRNPEWREIRTRLSPAFTSGKIKQMFALMEEIGYDLEAYLKRLTANGNQRRNAVVNIKEICDMYNTDMIASIAFGLRSYSLRNKQTELGSHCREMFTLTFRRVIDLCVIFFLPKFVSLLRRNLLAPAHAEFLRRTVLQVIEERERNGEMRNDLIEMLFTLKMEAALNQDHTHFTHQQDYLVAQAAMFELTGIESCAATMSFALYELAKQPLLQARLRAEIRRTIGGGGGAQPSDITYDKVMGMQYLTMVVEETLRKYPNVPILERECTPINKKRFYPLRPYAECFVRRGMPVYISNLAIHHDPQYWPEPERFDPQRFTPDNRKLQTPMSYLPFGAGPHNCIGMTIAQLQIKLGLLHFLRTHRVEICEKTVDNIEFDRKFLLLSNKSDIYLSVEKCL
ncbi:PREDICTED: probable cytochrome P450 6v1 [Rhagoletis zephyria]|uniref:probable cytochrome P450 6v1 n=1 Tax=Rhagoletis zephyria TaxID=28612 RepID=UPI0008112DC2|nr:PREDICTED: probable cytochrome P450 6v1 [Rhagoletis zephyria]